MKSFDAWLDEFKPKIIEGYETCRMDDKIAKFHSEVEKPVRRFIKFDEPIRFHAIGPDGSLPPPVTLKIRNVTPINAGFQIDMKNWADDPSRWGGMDSLMFQLGEQVALNEFSIIVRGMFDNAGNLIEAEEKDELKKGDIRKAVDAIRKLELFADSIIIHPEQLMVFQLNGELLEPWRISTGLPDEKRGRYFSGMLLGLSAYRTHFIKGVALVFERNRIKIVNTPLTISFDNMKKPSMLILERWCSSAPIIDNSIVKISLINQPS